MFDDDRLEVVRFGFGQGEELSEHSTPMPAVLLPKGMRHSIRAKTPVVVLVLLM